MGLIPRPFGRAEIPFPVVGDKEVLIRVKAIAVNPVEVKTRQGRSQAGRTPVNILPVPQQDQSAIMPR